MYTTEMSIVLRLIIQGISFWNWLFKLALRDRRTKILFGLWCLAASGGADICVSSTSFQKNGIGWPQQPPTEKVPKLNLKFHDSTQNSFFQNIKIKVNSNPWMTLKSSVVLFQAYKPPQPLWPQWPQQPQWPQWPWQPHFIKNFTDPDGLIIPSTQMTNTSPFLCNGS